MSGGARRGTGPKKQLGAPPTRKEKREARAVREQAAHAASTATMNAQLHRATVLPCTEHAIPSGICVQCCMYLMQHAADTKRQSDRLAAEKAADAIAEAEAAQAAKKGKGTLFQFYATVD